MKYPTRNWALISLGAGAGKSTFVAANCKPPIFVIDSDNRFDSVQALVPDDGQVHIASRKARINPLDMLDETEAMVLEGDIESIAVDSVTKIYSMHARRGSMRNRQGRGAKNKASEMIAKADAMAIIMDLAAFGTDIYYIWHETRGVDSKGKEGVRGMISEVERERLMTSVNVILKFFRENGRYGLFVDYARDYGGVPANIGFTMYDYPGNYWRGAGERLERLIYTRFKNQDDAINWGKAQLDEAKANVNVASLYEQTKRETKPKDAAQMWVAWITAVDAVLREDQAAVTVKSPEPEPEPEPEVESDAAESKPEEPEEPEGTLEHDESPDEFGDLFPPSTEVEDSPNEARQYGDGIDVARADLGDYLKYHKRFNKVPQSKDMLAKAIEFANTKGEGW